MKKLKFLLVALVISSVSLTSCSSDDGESGTAGDIVGKWNLVKTVVTFNGVDIEQEYVHQELECGKDYVEFKTNMDFSNVVHFRDADNACQTSAATVTNYNKAETMLSIASGQYSGIYTITLLTSADLHIVDTEGNTTTTYYFTRDTTN